MAHAASAPVGAPGVREIERLIQKLEIDKEILADPINADDLDVASSDLK